MSLSAIKTCMLSGLRGHIGSHPELLGIYPQSAVQQEDLINKSLPFGAKPNEFYVDTYQKDTILVYSFRILQAERDDLASIGFLLEKGANIDHLKIVIQIIIQTLEKANLLTFNILQKNLNTIQIGLNTQKAIVIENKAIDIAEIVRSGKLILMKKPDLKGGFF
jgi:hypothetical protein